MQFIGMAKGKTKYLIFILDFGHLHLDLRSHLTYHIYLRISKICLKSHCTSTSASSAVLAVQGLMRNILLRNLSMITQQNLQNITTQNFGCFLFNTFDICYV